MKCLKSAWVFGLVAVFLATCERQGVADRDINGSEEQEAEPFEHYIESVAGGSTLMGLDFYQPANAFDGNYGTNWIGTAPGNASSWVEARFDGPCKVGKVVLRDRLSISHNPKKVKLIFSDGQEITVDYPEEYTQGRAPLEVTFPPIRTESLRVRVLSNYTGPTNSALNEVEIFEVLSDGSYRKLVYEGPKVQALRKRRTESLEKIRQTQAYLNNIRAEIDLDAIPRYQTRSSIGQANKTVVVNKEPWSLTWSLATGCIIRSQIKSVNFDDTELGSFMVVDEGGKHYFQKYATDGSFEVKDSKFEVMISGSFTPRTKEGLPYPTGFDYKATVHKMSSLVEVHYFAKEAGPSFKEIRIVNTLGSKSTSHNQVYTYGYYPGIMTVAGCKTGLQCHLIDWDEENFGQGVSEKLLVQEDTRSERHIDVVLANVNAQPYPVMETGDEFNYAFSVLPVRIQAPFKPIWCHPWSGMPWSTGTSFGDEDKEYIKKYSDKWGETYFVIGAQWPTRITLRDDDLRRFIDFAHETGNKVMVYMDARWNNPDRVCYQGYLSYEEMRSARMLHALDNGLSLGSKVSAPVCGKS